MGYDMQTINYRGDDSVAVANRTGSNTDADYFRLNIWGMGTMREIMALTDVLTADGQVAWPDYPGDEHFGDEGEPTTEAGRAFHAASDAARSAGPGEGKVPLHKFCSNDGGVPTPDACRALARALRGVVEGGDGDVLEAPIEAENEATRRIFEQEVPKVSADDVEFWRRETLDFADFCERSAEHGDGFAVW